MSTNYAIDDVNGNQICDGLQDYGHGVRWTAQLEANRQGSTVRLYRSCGPDEGIGTETFEPLSAAAARRHLRRAGAGYRIALDGVGPARRGWFETLGARQRWLGASPFEAIAKLHG